MKGLTRKREEHIAQRRRWLAGAPSAAGLPAPRPVGPKNQAGRLARHAETRLLPAEHREMDDLRLDEIPAYLAACTTGTGRWPSSCSRPASGSGRSSR